ncbi:MAG: TlpA family protein disulfide reductase [Alphaproteobacteria bacterium]|nr:TlpA family protein disulfide reductase [Alphaproteobacteria bacterium]
MRLVLGVCLIAGMSTGCGVEEAVEPPGAPEVAAPAPPQARAAPKPVEAVGQSVTDLEVQDWLNGSTTVDSGEVTLVVFWELWCPHCRREVPKLQQWHEQLGPDGLNVVGLTRLTRNTTREAAAGFLEEQGVHYAAGVGGHDLANRLGIKGIPAAVAVKDGAVIWQGHPGRLTEEQLRAWL